ncbi:MAG: hypothetical protein FWH18_03790 [Marinilabiliaceae bacterium]|nr:hypothetical protein [Marinilabiliaceae bacterium]
MEKHKFVIRTIEEGRMENGEMKQVLGGDIGCSGTFFCPPGYEVDFCLNLYRYCPGDYSYCDAIAMESCSGVFSIKIPLPNT